MDNPADDKTIINVKGVPKTAWEAARRYAAQSGDSMGTWLAGAINCRIDYEEGRVKPPANNGHDDGNPPLTEDQLSARMLALAAMQHSAAAMKQAGGRAIGSRTIARRFADIDDDRLGRSRTISGKATGRIGQELPVNRQSGTILDAALPHPDSSS